MWQVKKYCPTKLLNNRTGYFFNSLLGKASEKQTKITENRGVKQIGTLKYLESSNKESLFMRKFISERRLNPDIIKEIENIKEQAKNW